MTPPPAQAIPRDHAIPLRGRERQGGTARTVVLTAASNLSLPLSALVTSPLLARGLGPDQRGELAAVLAPIALVALLATVGVPEALTYLVGSGRCDPRAALRAGVVVAGGAGTVAAVLVWALAPVLLAQAPDRVGLLRGLALLLPPTLAFIALRGLLTGIGAFEGPNGERWTGVLSRLALLAVAAAVGVLSVPLAAWVTNGTAVAAGAVLLLVFWRRVPRGPAGRTPWRAVTGYGARVWIGTLSLLVILRVDPVVMAPVVAPRELGFYAVAVALAEVPAAGFTALRDVVFSRASATTPRPSPDDGLDVATVGGRRSQGAGAAQGAELAAQASRLCLLAAIPALAIAILAVPPAIRVVFGPAFAPSAGMAQLLLAGALPAGLASVYGAGLLGRGRPGALSAAQFGVGVLSVVLVLVLAPRLGGLGAALASVATYVLLWVASAALFLRSSGLRVADLLVPRRDDLTLLRRAR